MTLTGNPASQRRLREMPWSQGLLFGGDYNPEQWPAEVMDDDFRLMKTAGVNVASVGIFSWATLEPREGEYDFSALESLLDRMHANGVKASLATATAAPPAWMSTKYPEILPVDENGVTIWHGSRQSFSPSSPIYRERAVALATATAQALGDHPAVALWHIHNEYGCHNALCYSDVSARHFREWLEKKYGSLDALNEAWGTTFWSQRYGAWEEIIPPRKTATFPNPTHVLDFRRFSSDALLECFVAERDAIRQITPDIPVTTNFLASLSDPLDQWKWAQEVDVVSTDHYLVGDLERSYIDLAMQADVARSLAGGKPWMLMEHSTSAVNWQDRNFGKAPGAETRNALSHVGRGSNAVCYFQWRQSKAGAEKFHSAMVPHGGEDTQIFREVTELGRVLRDLADVTDATVTNKVAMVIDWDSWWALETPGKPLANMQYLEPMRAYYASLWDLGVGVDFVNPTADLSSYDVVIMVATYVLSPDAKSNIESYVDGGGHLVVTPWSGIVDDNEHVYLGGYPGALRDVLGINVEQVFVLKRGQTTTLDNGFGVTDWTEWVRLEGATALASYTDGPVAGRAALTEHTYGSGRATYVSAGLDSEARRECLARAVESAGVVTTRRGEADLEVVTRSGDAGEYVFVLNHADAPAQSPVAGFDLVSGIEIAAGSEIAAGGAAVIRR